MSTQTTGPRLELAQNQFTIILALENVVENKILSDIKYLRKFCHTGNLKVFHSVLNKYCPKRFHFTLEGRSDGNQTLPPFVNIKQSFILIENP